MEEMTLEQIKEINALMEVAGDIYDASQRTALSREIFNHTSGKKIATFEQGVNTIEMIKNAIAKKNAIQKDEAKKAKALEKNINKSKEDNMKAIHCQIHNKPLSKVEWVTQTDDNGEATMWDSEEVCTLCENTTKEAKVASNTCTKCSGTGMYNIALKDGSFGKCFACKGTGIKAFNSKPMSDAQVKFIRDLFKEVKEKMTEDQINNLVNAMKAHISGTETKSMTWASAAIDKLKAIKATKA